MTARHTISPLTPPTIVDSGEYRAGSCNIGPAEIAQRRMFGHIALIASVAILLALVFLQAPAWTRLVLVITAGGSASGYLQARFHFCANFGSRGVYNFGAVGAVDHVASSEDRARDRARALQIGLASLAIGLAVGIVAAILPL